MIECPNCTNFITAFDSYFMRPRCFSCGWLPETMPSPVLGHLYELCGECWGYQELRKNDVCGKCLNEGKVLNSMGKEIVDLIRETIAYDR